MRFATLAQWLAWQETLHPSEIELGLERVAEVVRRLGLDAPSHAVITVGGTNGKGSSVALLESMLRAGGYRVGAYTSPHLLRYNERVRIDGVEATDAALCHAFERIDQARGDISLTYFEFGTLAAFALFAEAELDVAILEVGMGGRLDAVNVLEPDVALVTTVDVDHTQWLGSDRESIAREKAGIFRAGRPAVYGDVDVPVSLAAHALGLDTHLYRPGEDFSWQRQGEQWEWRHGESRRSALPAPALPGAIQYRNAAAVLMVLELLKERLPLSQGQIREGLRQVRLPGRFQVLPGEIPEILDVAHNPQAARVLADNLRAMPIAGRTHAVVAMLADKDVAAVVEALLPVAEVWHVAPSPGSRGEGSERLMANLARGGAIEAYAHADLVEARSAARAMARPGDRIVIFGSFLTVAAALGQAL